MPAQKKRIFRFGAGGDLALQADRAREFALGGFGAELAIGGEVVPEEHGTGPPFGGRPSSQVADSPASRREDAESDGATLGVLFRCRRIGHVQSLELIGQCFSKFVRPAVVLRTTRGGRDRLTGGIIERKGDRNRSFGFSGVANTIAQNSGGEAGVIGIERDKGTEGFERDAHRQAPILEGDPR